jgi:hypothetical protein
MSSAIICRKAHQALDWSDKILDPRVWTFVVCLAYEVLTLEIVCEAASEGKARMQEQLTNVHLLFSRRKRP